MRQTRIKHEAGAWRSLGGGRRIEEDFQPVFARDPMRGPAGLAARRGDWREGERAPLSARLRSPSLADEEAREVAGDADVLGGVVQCPHGVRLELDLLRVELRAVDGQAVAALRRGNEAPPFLSCTVANKVITEESRGSL